MKTKFVENKYLISVTGILKFDFLCVAIFDLVKFHGCHYYLYHPLGKPVNKRTIMLDNNNGNHDVIRSKMAPYQEIQTSKWLLFVFNFSHTLVFVSNIFINLQFPQHFH